MRLHQSIVVRTIAATITVLLLLVPLSALAAPSAQSSNLRCHGEAATIVYVGYDAAIYGTAGDDVIVVQGGWNRIHASGGRDNICVTGHFNLLEGEAGDDVISASGLHNTLSGNGGDDTLQADDASNTLRGGDGDNRCNGESC